MMGYSEFPYLRYSQTQCQDPDGYDELDSPGQLADGVGEEGVADGDVSLHSEGGDGEHRRVRRGLLGERCHAAKEFPEHIRKPATINQVMTDCLEVTGGSSCLPVNVS